MEIMRHRKHQVLKGNRGVRGGGGRLVEAEEEAGRVRAEGENGDVSVWTAAA